ncbi:MAG TPA: hypothetical protein VFS24_19825 [Steroidobacteraceae bacterium]|nr:hypothetical protein [Steroidobacteraceae bacterium]
MSDSIVQRTSRLLTAALMLALSTSCGGGGGGGTQSASTPSGVAIPPPSPTPQRPVDQSDLDIAQATFGEKPRTPNGFYSDAKPSGYQYVSTMQLKNADIDPSVTDSMPLHELCTDDWNQALQWSETSAEQDPTYADLVDTSTDDRYFEFGRVRQGEPQFYLRERVFRCGYLNRDSANLRVAQGAAGQFNERPLTADELKNLSEYLWQFTEYNNFGHAVLKSAGTSSGAELDHTIYIANLTRAGVSASCDRIDVISWRHRLDAATGILQLEVQLLWSFGARQTSGVTELCNQ